VVPRGASFLLPCRATRGGGHPKRVRANRRLQKISTLLLGNNFSCQPTRPLIPFPLFKTAGFRKTHPAPSAPAAYVPSKKSAPVHRASNGKHLFSAGTGKRRNASFNLDKLSRPRIFFFWRPFKGSGVVCSIYIKYGFLPFVFWGSPEKQSKKKKSFASCP